MNFTLNYRTLLSRNAPVLALTCTAAALLALHSANSVLVQDSVLLLLTLCMLVLLRDNSMLNRFLKGYNIAYMGTLHQSWHVAADSA
jgi:hypothetical protein